MKQTLYFYDLETSGVNPRSARIMQFAGQRVDLDLKSVGEPHNVLIKLSEDTLPEPDAILITGITPQQTKVDGVSEAEFLKLFETEIATPGTIFIGFNTVRFDDEFMRFLRYRNFYDPYDWQYKDGKSRWDLLDVTRMMRALRPEGIEWPVDSNGKSSNRLELLTAMNKLDHANAHDALSDVLATIDLARLIKKHQPKFFSFLLEMRQKSVIGQLVNAGQPFVYTSGKYPGEFEKTTIVSVLAKHPTRKDAVLVYDLRHDPEPFLKMSTEELVEAWRWKPDVTEQRLPVKTLQFNRCPAVAPLSVLDEASQKRIQLTPEVAQKNLTKLHNSSLDQNVLQALEVMNKQQQARLMEDEQEVDAQLYDSFLNDADKPKMQQVREATIKELATVQPDFRDQRLKLLLPLYKARNFPRALTNDERAEWDAFCRQRLLGGGPSRAEKYFERLAELSQRPGLTTDQRFLLEELQLYGESILPSPDY